MFVLKNVWLIHFSSKAELEELLCQIKSIHIFKGSTVRFCSVCVWGMNQTFLLGKSVVEANFFFSLMVFITGVLPVALSAPILC